jgi:pimeloyl-ACP methyl ester carboxylesterase
MTTKIQKSEEQAVQANGIEIVYDTFGDPNDPPMLLIMGLAAQMIAWDEEFCAQLAAKGYWVIRFDNRDIGLSSKFEHLGIPDKMEVARAFIGKERLENPPYLLKDMAEDTIGFMDALKIDSAHVAGVSMGGMIAQEIAIHFPERLRTLTSIMASTGNPELPLPTQEALMVLTAEPADQLDKYIEDSVKAWTILAGPHLPIPEDKIRRDSEMRFKRSYYPQGSARQFGAIISSGSRHKALKSVKVPALVIHGDADPLVPVEGGIDTAESIPGAKLEIIEGMGHALPPAVWSQVIQLLAAHAV